MPHLALLGDSVFDNGAYVAGGPDVGELVRARLPADWTASMHAVDGSTATDIPGQLERLPKGTTHLVLSVGGNDALVSEHLLLSKVASTSEALLLLAGALDEFERNYRQSLAPVLALGKDLTVCTVYNANFTDPLHARCVRIAVALFDDVILRVAREHAVKTIDLRLVCDSPADYSNDIEPSVIGGRKIAAAIVGSLGLAPG
jgi:hypothetical protein